MTAVERWLLLEALACAILAGLAWHVVVRLRDDCASMMLRCAVCALAVFPAMRSAALFCTVFQLPSISLEWVKFGRTLTPLLSGFALVLLMSSKRRGRG